jgi:Uma2 family endonuclease
MLLTRKKGRDNMPIPQERTYTSEDYWNLPEGQRAELIDGKLYAMAPPNRIHQRLVSRLTQTLGSFIDSNKGTCEVYPAPFAVNLNANDKVWVEPDISVICDEDKLSDHGCEGAPDWIIEILSPSSIRTDCAIKLFKYRSAGVREYWIVNPSRKSVQTYIFEGEEDANIYSFDDEIPVYIFNGLIIKISDLI